MTITAEAPVRDMAIELPTAIPALEDFGIDYFCNGKHQAANDVFRRCTADIAGITDAFLECC